MPLEVTVERLGAIEVRLNFEVTAAECDRELNGAYKAYASRMKLPGFRPGKVPVRRIKKQIEQQVIHEVSEVIIDRAYREAVQNEDLRPVSAPQVDGHPHCHEGEAFRFAMTVEVRPEIELKKVDGFAIELETRNIGDEDVAKELQRLRQSKAEYTEADEGAEAEKNHKVSVTFDAFQGEEKIADGESRSFYLGDEDLEDQIRQALLGAKVGETVEADITFSDDNDNPDLAGETIKHSFEVTKLETAALPELDDDFAKGFETDDLESLTTAVHERLEAMAQQHGERQFEEALLDALVEANPFEVPPGLVQAQIDNTLRRSMPGVSAEQLAGMGVNLDEFREQIRPQALKGIQIGLLLEEIAEAEDLSPGPQEVAQEMVSVAQRSGEPLAKVQAQFKKPEVMEQIVNELRHRKALQFVLQAAKGAEAEEQA
jgi:trigger factor